VRNLVAGLLVLVALVASRAALRGVPVSSVPWPVALTDDRFNGGGSVGLVSVPPSPWTLLVGGSSMFYGVELGGLPGSNRKQTVARGLPTDLFAVVSWDLATLPDDRLPERILVALHPTATVDRRKLDRESPCGTVHMTERLEQDDFEALGCGAELTAQSWTLRVDRWQARRAMVARAGGWWLARLLGRPEPEPGPDLGLEAMRGTNPTALAARMKSFARTGVFAQPPDPVQVRALERLHAATSARGVPLVGVLMPEHSLKREQYPEGAAEGFAALIGAHTDEVLDLRTALPDDHLFDEAHPNELGRDTLTARFASERAR
jgi:hypothetical protein